MARPDLLSKLSKEAWEAYDYHELPDMVNNTQVQEGAGTSDLTDVIKNGYVWSWRLGHGGLVIEA